MKFSTNDGLLVVVAIIWGSGFVAQKIGAEQLGPYLFNGSRFLLGALVVLPLYLRTAQRKARKGQTQACLLIGLSLFLAATLQQIGIAFTTSGKSGFITGLYVVIVPFIMFFLGHRLHLSQWLSSLLALIGLALLSLSRSWTLERGDLFTLGSAVFWATQSVLFHLYRRHSASAIAFYQFLICGVLSLLIGLLVEDPRPLLTTWKPVVYSGLVSVGLGFSLQVYAQQRVLPNHAVLFLSLESVFAMAAGVLFLAEPVNARILAGAALILVAILLSQRHPHSAED